MILIDHQNFNLPNGTREYGPVDVDDTWTTFTVRLAACTTATPTIWPNASTTVKASIVMSYDGGVTFPRQVIFFTGAGGIHTAPNGSEAIESWATGYDAAATGRRVKAITVVAGGPLHTEVTVEVI